MNARLDPHDVAQMLNDRIESLAAMLLPGGRRERNEWRAGSVCGDDGASLAVTLTGNHQGRWRDFATDERGDALDLVAAALGTDKRGALEWARRWLGLDSGEARAPARRNITVVKAGDDEGRRINGALAIWDEAVESRGTLVEAYLASRALELTAELAHDVLRYHPACPWREGDASIRVPAMVALMRQVRTDTPTAIHRTRLSREGVKIDRRMLGVAAGAAIKLDADETVTGALHIAEGIESAMSARQFGFRPTWATSSAGAIEAFPVLGGVDALTILGEHDDASRRAVKACGDRWLEAGREVFCTRPTIGKDLNDALRGVS